MWKGSAATRSSQWGGALPRGLPPPTPLSEQQVTHGGALVQHTPSASAVASVILSRADNSPSRTGKSCSVGVRCSLGGKLGEGQRNTIA